MSSTSIPSPVSFYQALLYWLKLGFVSFGGPAGQIAMMHQELVERRRWISEQRFLHALSYCNVLPGPEAQQLATYIGWLMHGTWGGVAAGVLFVLPSLFVLIALSWIYMAFGSVPAVAAVLDGVKPVVIAIIVFAAYRIGSRALKNWALWMIAAAAFLAILVFGVHFPYIILFAGVLGYFGGRLYPAYFKTGGHHGGQVHRDGPALIDDHTPLPEHARFRWARAILFTVVGLLLWAAAMLLLKYGGDAKGVYLDMGGFFTKAALYTVGGAYAVLPYVCQNAVENYQWLNASQMIDGLALGETTPGPLIMVVAFVGFVGAWTHQVFGSEQIALAGIIGASVATFFTFLPSFIFILVGAPGVERSRHAVGLTAPLAAITAAVVGVIMNLGVFFAVHVLWPGTHQVGCSSDQLFNASYPLNQFAWGQALVAVGAFMVLWRFNKKVGIIPVILAGGMIGLVMLWVRPLLA